MPEPIKRFIETFIPGTTCNLKCHYCYLAQDSVSTNQKACFSYSRETMKKAINKERLGGACYFNLCADGETLLEPRTVEFLKDVLEEGHYAVVVTNGTLTKRFDEICSWPLEMRQRIMFIFSFHYLELERLHLTKIYFENIRKMWDAGCSWFASMVQCEEYIERYDEIKKLFLDEVGVLPQVSKYRDDQSPDVRIKTSRPIEEYFQIGMDAFDSPAFDFERNTYQKKIHGFCYAGDWLCYLNLCTGELRACYGYPPFDNLFEHPEKPIHFQAVGKHCNMPYCYNGLSRLTIGVVPDEKFEEYWKYRNRTSLSGRDTFSDYMKAVTSKRLYETNQEYSEIKKAWTDLAFGMEYHIKPRIQLELARLTPKRIACKIKKTLSH